MEKEMSVAPQERMFILKLILDCSLDLFGGTTQLQIVLTMPLKRLRSLPQKPKPIRDRCIDSCVIWQAWTSYRSFRSMFCTYLAATLQKMFWFHAVRSDRTNGLRLFRLDQRIEQFKNGVSLPLMQQPECQFLIMLGWTNGLRKNIDRWEQMGLNSREWFRPTHCAASLKRWSSKASIMLHRQICNLNTICWTELQNWSIKELYKVR